MEAETGNQTVESDLHLVVGIGASAGGLDALQVFFSHCPPDLGAAFVVVQHLSPDFKSMMDHLLSRCTDMPVSVAEDGETVLSNHVYLIPARKSMIIAEGTLLLTDAAPHVALSLPIDTFFRSLAEDQQNRAVGIVLSGTGSDGSRGIAGIKEVGGLVLVQDPAEAKFDGMPKAALASGYVDHSFPVGEVPRYLESYKKNYSKLASDFEIRMENPQEAESILEEVCNTVQKHVHIDLKDYKRSTIGRRIDKRASLHQLDSWADYLEFLRNNSQEQSALGKEILIGVTSFFRDEEMFETLRKVMIPAVLKHSTSSKEIRIWCAGCSTGEEAYSIAITLVEVMADLDISRNFKIFATDIDASAVHEASLGQFSARIADEMTPTILGTYFTEKDGGYEIDKRIRQKVVFAVHNVISDPPFSNMDLVFCRNLLIYLDSEPQKKVQLYLNFALNKDGYLTLGPSESLVAELTDSYTAVDRRLKQYIKIKNERMLLDSRQLQPREAISSGNKSLSPVLQTHVESRQQEALSMVFKDLSETYAPPTLVFNQDNEVMYSIGDCTPYTKKISPGPSSFKVDAVLDEGLLVAVTTAMQKAKREAKTITYLGVSLPNKSVVDLSVSYAELPGPSQVPQACLLVSFLNRESGGQPDQAAIQFDEKQMMDNRIEDLEYELQQSRASLAVTVEELQTSNEELQSTNEELMAANEEMQSTNEELQSVNEELYSVNSEYQHKVILLEESTTDFENLMKNPSVCLLALDKDLRVKHYSPSVTRYFKLINADLGRSIEDITHSLSESFAIDCRQVLDSNQELSREYRSQAGELLTARTTPYVNLERVIDGVVVCFADITHSTVLQEEREQLVQARALLDQRHARLENMLNPLSDHKKIPDLRFLIIEDDLDDGKLIEQHLMRSELFKPTIELCTTIEEGRRMDRDSYYDVVLLDYLLGDGDASEFLKSRSKSAPPIILLTALDKRKLADLREFGVFDFIAKKHLSTVVLEKSLHLTLQSYQVGQFLSSGGEINK